MHPFSLKKESAQQVTGGLLLREAITWGINETGGCIPYPFPKPFPPIQTTMAIGENGDAPVLEVK